MSDPKHALVTGASGAIGRSVSILLNDSGWIVHGTYHRNPSNIPDGISPREADFSDPKKAAKNLRMYFNSRSQALHALVHTAGPVSDRALLNMSVDEWRSIRKTHLDSSFFLAKSFGPLLREGAKNRESPAHYVLFSSLVGLQGSSGQGNYASAKSSLIGFTFSLADEWADQNILVNAIRPPLTDSKMYRQIPESVRPEVEETILTGEVGDPEQTAELVKFLLSRDNITGQLLSADNRIHSPWS